MSAMPLVDWLLTVAIFAALMSVKVAIRDAGERIREAIIYRDEMLAAHKVNEARQAQERG